VKNSGKNIADGKLASPSENIISTLRNKSFIPNQSNF